MRQQWAVLTLMQARVLQSALQLKARTVVLHALQVHEGTNFNKRIETQRSLGKSHTPRVTQLRHLHFVAACSSSISQLHWYVSRLI